MNTAYLMKKNLLRIELDNSFHNGNLFQYSLLKNGVEQSMILTSENNGCYYFHVHYEYGQKYQLKVNNGFDLPIVLDEAIRTDAFEEEFMYDGPLGPIYTKECTKFYVWAPAATEMYAIVDTKPATVLTFDRQANGVYTGEYIGDLHNVSYRLFVKNHRWEETIDPYAYANIENSTKSLVIDIDKINHDLGKDKITKTECFTDNVIYELHVRDYSIFGDQQNKGKYISFTEDCNHDLTYIKNLGVTHLQLLPVYDFGSVYDENNVFYNWGYDPVQMNTIEGSYTVNPNSFDKLIEFKKMVKKIHESGLRVVMDVVFNHVFNRETFCLEKLVPGYFFRYGGKRVSNGSFCGNDFESLKYMSRRYIIDSCMRFVNEFGVDGFRFDLMGINDIETINMLRNELDKVDPTLMLYGEGWSMYDTLVDQSMLATIKNHAALPKIQFFNDGFRDGLKQLHDLEIVRRLLQKKCYYLPYRQSINYVECHDNETLYDYLDGDFQRHQLLTTLTIIAPGIPFLHAGQEFYRTKKDVENSYCSPDEINGLDWDRCDEHSKYQEYIKRLIKFKKSRSAFKVDNTTVTYERFDDLDKFTYHNGSSKVVVYINFNDYPVYKDILYTFNSYDLSFDDKTSVIEPFSCVIRG